MIDDKYLIFKTSGSTGNPATILYDKKNIDVASAVAAFRTFARKEDFKKFIEKIKLPDSTLMKYTSILETSCSEYMNCKNCKNILECKNKVCGYAYLPKIEKEELVFNYKPCRYKEKMDKATKHLNNIYMLGVNNYIVDACIENIYKEDKKRHETIKWILNFLKTYEKNKNQRGLYLSGSFGCGKTYLISALFNELAKKGYKSSIIFWPEFLRDLKSSFEFDFKEKFDTIKTTPILLIDDIGSEVVTPWARDEILCTILQYRMQEHLPTFFTTNFNKEELEVHLSNGNETLKAKRIMERINQLTDSIEMISDNLRN